MLWCSKPARQSKVTVYVIVLVVVVKSQQSFWLKGWQAWGTGRWCWEMTPRPAGQVILVQL
jgi:hypothetical protein